MASTAGLTDQAYLVYLRRLLVQRFSLNELRTLCFDLGVDAESLAGPSLSMLAREFVGHMAHRRRIPDLVSYIRGAREDIDLAPMPESVRVPDSEPQPYGPAASVAEPQPAWSVLLPGQPMAAPVVLGTTCLIAYQTSGRESQGGVLRALDISTGQPSWEHRFENAVVGGLSGDSGTCALASLLSLGPTSGGSSVVAVTHSGRVLWEADLEVTQISAAALSSDLVAVTGDSRRVVLLHRETGEIIADVASPVQVAPVPPACDTDQVYVPCRAPSLLAINRAGDVRWRFDIDGVLSGVQLDQTPLVAGPYVVAVLSSGSVLALTRDAGRLVWETQVGPRGKRLTSPVSDGRRVFVGARDGVYALSLLDGSRQWVYRTGAYVTASPTLDGDLLCIAGNDRHLYGVDRRTGSLLWQVTMARKTKTAPALAPGDHNGPYVVTVDCSGRVTALTYPVPAFAHEAAGRWSKAARVWQAEGDLTRAAKAWVRHAESIGDREALIDGQSEAWSAAAQLFTLVGMADRASSARRRYAECLGLPLVTLEIQHDGLVANTWSRLRMKVQNEGYGVARDVVIRVAGDQFDGQITETRVLPAVPAGETLEQELTVKPLEYGDSVPLNVQISYRDHNGEPHRREELLSLQVSKVDARSAAASFVIPAQGAARRVARGLDELQPCVDIEIRVRRGRRDYDVELTLDGGQVFSGGHLSKAILSWVSDSDAAQDGQYLFNALLRDRAVRKGWHIARGQAEQRGVPRRVRLRIDDDAAELHQLPWELLHEDGVMLSASERTPFSRYLPIDKPWGVAIIDRPIRVLAVIANPSDITARYNLPPLNSDLERYLLARSFAAIDPTKIQLTFLRRPITLERLSRTMLEGYDWLHFVGHGRLNARYQRVDLLMENDQGNTRAIGDNLFSGMLARQGVQPQLVFLSVCQSAGASTGEVLASLGPQLVRIGIPAVVAMRGQLPMHTAQEITRSFYRGLVEHGLVDRALNQARNAVLSAQLPGAATPVLFMHLASGRLWRAGDLSLPE